MHHTELWVHALGLNKFSGHAVRGVFDLFRSAAGDKPTARFTAAGAHIENIISAAALLAAGAVQVFTDMAALPALLAR